MVSMGAAVSAEAGPILIKNRGSDTMSHLAQAWAANYHQNQPEVSFDVRGCGSGSGFSALLNGSADLANASRPIQKKELAEAAKNGVAPREFVVAHDALAIFVHKGNPLEWLSMNNLADLFADGGFIDDWTKLGVTVPGCANNKIVLVGRKTDSGTHAFFQEAVLGSGREFKHNELSKDMNDSDEVMAMVEKEPCAIGYSGLAYETTAVKKLRIAKEHGSQAMEANGENAVNRSYPLARPLYMYANGEPKGEVRAYMDWVLSDAGQCLVAKIGYAPIRAVKCTP
ncbi:MAG: PstS family phosphate ABC transporter substrate-binding protein [Magnetococcales bacterium]|nr:PstS family phosphate ABC transporter substrate-binding protein [Magnetococcales bacterium]